MKRKLFLIALVIGSICTSTFAQGFLKRDNKRIIDGSGNNFILRGIGLGGWMLQEGYMLQMESFANPQNKIKAKIEAVIGKVNTDTFYQAWLDNYMQKVDVDSLKAYGFNSIRLPMHYNLFTLPIEDEPVAGENTWLLDKGFKMVDSLLAWCKANQIYLILDMHAAPGGQGMDSAISDYTKIKPSLWESDANKAKLVALWKKLAERYANEEWIGAYDLLNEINWDFENSGNINGCSCNTNKPLLDLYKSIISAIREVDQNHICILEGNCWGNNYNGLSSLKLYDNNLAISFHKYWNSNESSAISGILGLRTTMNMPLWCGESGENSNHWYTEAISMLEKNNIGWAWWSYKKLGSINGTNNVLITPEYTSLLNYMKNGGTKPSVENAKATLMKIADNLKLENCVINHGVMDAMFRQVSSNETKPYKKTTLPGNIFATEYDYGHIKFAYYDTDSATYTHDKTYISWNQGWGFRNDGVDIEACNDIAPNMGYSIGWTAPGEWLAYTVNIDSTTGYKLNFRYASANISTIHLTLDGEDITGPLKLAATGGWATWKTASFDNIILSKGKHKLVLNFDISGSNVNYLGFEYASALNQIPLKVLSANTSENGTKIYLNLNNAMPDDVVLNTADFTSKIAAINNIVTNVSRLSARTIVLNLTDTVVYGQTVTVSYVGTSVKDTSNKALAAFSDMAVANKRPTAVTVPANIQAENYYFQSGLSLETCTDVGAGKNIAYTNAGDYLDYYLLVKEAASFDLSFRVAANAAGGSLEFFIVDGDKKTSLGTLAISGTGGWQKWSTVTTSINLPKGQLLFRVQIKSPEFNINWFSFAVSTVVNAIEKNNSLKIFPNPANNRIQVISENACKGNLSIFNLDGKQLLQHSINEPITDISIQSLKNGMYVVKFVSGSSVNVSSLLVKR